MSSPSFISYLQSFATHSSVWHALPILQPSQAPSMNDANTINPGQLSNMADQNDDYDFFDNLDLGNFDPNVPYDMTFDPNVPGVPFNESSGFSNDLLNEPQEFVPMQQQYNQLPFDSTPNQAAPAFVPLPDTAYHPDIGWYYPLGPASMPAQQQIPTVAPYNAPLVAESIEMPEPSRPSTGKNKRKYGPSVYVEQQAKRRAIGDDSGPRPVSRESVDFHVAGRKTKQKSGTASKPKNQPQQGGKASDLKGAIVKPCRCPAAKAAKAAHIPRPPNSFMLFRSDFSSEQATCEGEKRSKGNATTSTTAAAKWRADKKANKGTEAKYQKMADEEARQHKERHPDYKYDPSIMIRARFGRPDCTCGAYVKNRAALLKKSGAGHNDAIRENEDEDGGEDDDDDDDDDNEKEGDGYVMPTTRSMSRSNSLAPAPVDQTDYYQFDFNIPDDSINVPDFGFSLQSQNGAAESQWYAQQDYVDAAENTYVPPVTRRSTRLVQKAGGQFEFSDNAEDLEGDVEMVDSTPREKRRPPQITSARNASPKMSEFVKISPESDGPASRTCSKSLSLDEGQFQEVSTADDLFGDGWFAEDVGGPVSRTRSKSSSFDEGQFQEASMNDDLFGDGYRYGAEEDVGENIIVATPMTGLSKISPRNRSGFALPDSQARSTRGQSRGSR